MSEFQGSGRLLSLASRLKMIAPRAPDEQDELPLPVAGPAADSGLSDADVIITHIEVNDKHGVGSLVRKIFLGEPSIVSIRSKNLYEGDHQFGDRSLCISHAESSRSVIFERVCEAMGSTTVRRIVCIPYFPDDAWNGIALKEIYGASLCTYLMDDQNIYHNGIPDPVMRELLMKSDFRLAISQEMRLAYQQKYSCRMDFMPPVVPARLIPSRLVVPPFQSRNNVGIMVGNIWGNKWVELLRKTVRGAGTEIHWFCNGEFRWIQCSHIDLAKDSIIPHAPPCDDDLVKILRNSWYAILPSGTLDDSDDRSYIAQLSLPSRLVYLIATAHIPVIVLGNRNTPAARFVTQSGTGLVCEYDSRSFSNAVAQITDPATNLRMRRQALLAAGRFSDIGAAEWIWQSLACGRPADSRYEDLLPLAVPSGSNGILCQNIAESAPLK